MASAQTSQAISGAAQGAAAGSLFGVPGVVIGGVVGGVAGLISGGAADSAFGNQMAWAQYNAQSQYNTDMFNINSSLMLSGFNAALGLAAGRYNAQQVLNTATYNAEMIGMTTAYNEDLLENELSRIWVDLDLDIGQIEMFRARERGNMIADQAASGTIIGDGSNAIAVQDQMTQEAMDIAIIEFGADRQAANINNAIAQGRWQGEVSIQQTMWEGQVQANSIMFNSKLQAASTVMGAVVQANSNMYSAKQAYMTAGYNQQQASYQFSQQNTQDMVSGLFQAAGTAATGYFATKAITPKTTPKTTYSGPLSPGATYNTPRYLAKGSGTPLTKYGINTTLTAPRAAGGPTSSHLLTSTLGR